MESFKVSQSKVKLWRQCRKAYFYKYRAHLKKRKVKRPLQFGRLIHEMLEAYANNLDPFSVLDNLSPEQLNMFRAEFDQYGDIITDARLIMQDYFEHWEEDSLIYVPRGKKYAEHDFEVDVGYNIIVKGKIDAIGRANSLRWLVEHKTFTRMPNEDHRWRNVQSAVYLRIMELMGWPAIDGVVWDYIRSKAPPRPEILKSGQMSLKKIETLPSAVWQTIMDNGLDPNNYQEFLRLTEENRPSYFTRIFTPLNRNVVDVVFNDFLHTAIEMSELHDQAASRTIGQHCDFCDYEPICRAIFMDLDVEHVIKKEYTKDETQDNYADPLSE